MIKWKISISSLPLLLIIYLIRLCLSEKPTSEVRQLCQSVTKNCAECIDKHPQCAWCADPRWNGSQRCDGKWVFAGAGTCAAGFIYSPTTEIKLAPQHNLAIGAKRIDGITIIQLEPQQIEVKVKPGDVVEIPFHYLHKPPASGYEVRDFTIQTSEFRSLGLDVNFSIDCNGVCPNVVPDQKINFFAKLSLKDCSNPSQMAVSIGIYGYNTVSAIYIHPICGCDCEIPRNQERRSPRCSYRGNLICGQCQCDQGMGGDQCECDLNSYGVAKPSDLTDQCKEHKFSPVCSGHGRCSCGKCQCPDHIKGRFCECDNENCPLSADGKMCSGQGVCDCGRCICEKGWGADDCGCSEDQTPCTERGIICSNNGICECGKCACNVGWTGPNCSVDEGLPEQLSPNTVEERSKASSEEDEFLPEEPLDRSESREDKSENGEVSTASQSASTAQGRSHSILWIFIGNALLLLLKFAYQQGL